MAHGFQKYPKNFAFAFYNFAVTGPWNLLFSQKVAYFLTISIVFSVYKQNFTAQ